MGGKVRRISYPTYVRKTLYQKDFEKSMAFYTTPQKIFIQNSCK